MSNDQHSKIGQAITRIAVLALLSVAAFGAGLISGGTRNAVYEWSARAYDTAAAVFRQVKTVLPGAEPVDFLQVARREGSGVTVNDRGDDGQLVMLSGLFDRTNAVRLLRRDGTVVREWPMSYKRHFPDAASFLGFGAPQTDWNVDLHGAVLNPDGSLVVNYEYAGTVKLSRCGEVEWTLRHPTHHSIDPAEGGGYWIPGRYILKPGEPGKPDDRIPPYTLTENWDTFVDDLILRVSEDGEILEEVPVARIFLDSGLGAALTASGSDIDRDGGLNTEIVHVNKITELGSELAPHFPGFAAGDLMISLRAHNLVAVVDPKVWRVKWYQIGPWLRQHDPEFEADGTISVFNNNSYRIWLGDYDRQLPDAPRVSDILKIDPETRQVSVAYGNRPGQEFLTVIRGKQQPTPGGGYIITEFEGGRAFETDSAGSTVWEYINRYDDTYVAEMTDARLYPESYFTVQDWSCPEKD